MGGGGKNAGLGHRQHPPSNTLTILKGLLILNYNMVMAKYELKSYGECDPGVEEMAAICHAQALTVLTRLQRRKATLALAALERMSLTEITARILKK